MIADFVIRWYWQNPRSLSYQANIQEKRGKSQKRQYHKKDVEIWKIGIAIGKSMVQPEIRIDRDESWAKFGNLEHLTRHGRGKTGLNDVASKRQDRKIVEQLEEVQNEGVKVERKIWDKQTKESFSEERRLKQVG